jgi:hypothetical protein
MNASRISASRPRTPTELDPELDDEDGIRVADTSMAGSQEELIAVMKKNPPDSKNK